MSGRPQKANAMRAPEQVEEARHVEAHLFGQRGSQAFGQNAVAGGKCGGRATGAPVVRDAFGDQERLFAGRSMNGKGPGFSGGETCTLIGVMVGKEYVR